MAIMSDIRLPQLRGVPMVTDGGMETDLIFHRGVDLPDFAAFPLVDSVDGRALLRDYYDGYAAIARAARAGLMLESPTWRANPEWGARLGYTGEALAQANIAAIGLLASLRDRYADTISDIVISGMIGPRGDGYRPGEAADPARSADYHRPQVEALARAGADMVSAYTLTDVGEAIGIVQSARACGLPVAISFTVETDGRLPDGTPLAQAIQDVDGAAKPDYFLVNCAHPRHVAAGLTEAGTWRERIIGLRCNASEKSHAELDEATELDESDPVALAAAHASLAAHLPQLTIVGGCCGTDSRHVAALWRDRTAPSPFVLRAAALADAPEVADLYLRARKATRSIPAIVHSDDDVRRWFREVVLPRRETWLAERGGEPVALMVLDGEMIDQLYVHPQWTGRGAGSELMRLAKSRRPAGLSLWTFQANVGAQRFYERHGFDAVERTDGHGNEERAPDVRYVWQPAPPPHL